MRGLNQAEIAKHLQLSRPTVISYLKLARNRQIVGVKLAALHFRVNDLADKMWELLGLQTVIVVPDNKNPDQALLNVCEAAAHYLPEYVEQGDVLGVSWGQTVSFVSKRLPWWPISNLTVRQLTGSMANPLLPTCESCTTEISRRLSAHCVNLNAPAVCSDAKLASRLRAEPIISEQLERLLDCNKAIYSLSPCSFDTHVVQFKVATRDDISAYVAKGRSASFPGVLLMLTGLRFRGILIHG